MAIAQIWLIFIWIPLLFDEADTRMTQSGQHMIYIT